MCISGVDVTDSFVGRYPSLIKAHDILKAPVLCCRCFFVLRGTNSGIKTEQKTMKGKPRRDWIEFNIISRRGSVTYKDSCRAWGPDLIGLIVQKD